MANNTTLPKKRQGKKRISLKTSNFCRQSLVDYLLARAMSVAFAGGNHQPIIWLARDAARLEEGKAAR